MDSGGARGPERRFFWYAVLVAGLLHVGGAMALVWGGPSRPVPQFAPLASMDFSPYDPEGGEQGGGAGAFAEKPEPLQARPEPEPEPEPEAREEVQVVESRAEKAEPVAPPQPPLEKPKPKPRPVAKPKPKTVQEAAPTASTSAGAGSGSGESGAGSGQGEGKGGSGGGRGSGNPDIEKAYLAHVIQKLNRHKKYPAAAKAERLGGVVTVSFTVNRQGQVTVSRMSRSSGHHALDQEAMALLKRVSPFKPIPEAMHQTSLRLTVPVRFSVQ